MLAPKKLILVSTEHQDVTFSRKDVYPKTFLGVSDASMTRLHRAVNKEVNKLYGPRIEVMFGGWQVEW